MSPRSPLSPLPELTPLPSPAFADLDTPPPVAVGNIPPPLPPSVEEAYRKKCIELKRRMTEVEESNDVYRLRKARLQRGIRKMRLERAYLLEILGKRMKKNGSSLDGFAGVYDEDSEGSSEAPPTVCERSSFCILTSSRYYSLADQICYSPTRNHYARSEVTVVPLVHHLRLSCPGQSHHIKVIQPPLSIHQETLFVNLNISTSQQVTVTRPCITNLHPLQPRSMLPMPLQKVAHHVQAYQMLLNYS